MKRLFKFALYAFAGVVVLVVIGMILPKPPPSTESPAAATTSTPAPTPAPPSDVLELLSSHGYNEHTYHFVEGQVRNISNRPLENVAAVTEWFTKDNDLVKTADALIDYNPILPGQTAPFKTITSSNPAMTNYTVTFKTLGSGTLGTKDSRKK